MNSYKPVRLGMNIFTVCKTLWRVKYERTGLGIMDEDFSEDDLLFRMLKL